MEKPKHFAKLLLFRISDPFQLCYSLGRHNILLLSLTEIKTSERKQINPFVAVVKYYKDKDITKFIKSGDFEAMRIFKTAIFRNNKVRTKAFLYSSANNLLALLKGKTLRIDSKNPELSKQFYNICVEVNKEFSLGVSFDYDVFDCTASVREYKEKNKHWLIITTDLDKVLESKSSKKNQTAWEI